MRRRAAATVLTVLIGLGIAGGARATTWFPQEMACPVCGEQVTVDVVGSYGSYIYRWPSRYQMVFWPFTTGNALHHCPHCGTTAFLGDFAKIPEAKRADIRAALAAVRERPGPRSGTPYRLALAEAVYRQLDRDDDFWCHFYRVQGLHLEKARDIAGAATARGKALTLARKMLKWALGERVAKELRLIVGAMHFYRGEADEARRALALAIETPVPVVGEVTAAHAARMTDFLDDVANGLLTAIDSGRKPGE